MDTLVVTNPSNWKLPLDKVEVVSARDYLAPGNFRKAQPGRVFNLCRSYQYQSIGYYVSLLAEARGQRVIPSVATLRDFKNPLVARSLGEEITETIQSALKSCEGNDFELEIYFAQSIDPSFRRLAAQLYRLFPAPLLRASFFKQQNWQLRKVSPIALSSLADKDRSALQEMASDYFRKKGLNTRPQKRFLYDLAILVDKDEPHPPSDPEALEKFVKAAREMEFYRRIARSFRRRIEIARQ